MFIIKTQSGKLVNMDHIESISIVGKDLKAYTPSDDYYLLYTDDNQKHLKKALDYLFESLTSRSSGFDFSVPAKWEGEQDDN